jgi:hypothetical protein
MHVFLRLALLSLTGVVTLVLPRQALAQSCHLAPTAMRTDGVPAGSAFRASIGSVFASYRNAFGEGEYQGLNAAFAYQHPWVFAAVSVPGYRLVRNQEARTELGDVALDVRGTAYRDPESGFALGLGLAATLPTANEKFGFGMGHVMLMPGLWLSLARELFIVRLEASYGRALGAHHGAHAHGGHMHGPLAGSIVQPMNASEVEHALSLTLLLHEHARVLGRLFGAVPVADTAGQTREIVALGVQGILGIWDLSLEAQLPLVGSPFIARTVLSVGAEW